MKFKIILLNLFFFSFFFANAQKTNLEVGKKMPYFYLLDQYGEEFDSRDYLGKKALVIFFYPKNNAKVCTKQVCAFRDNYPDFEKLDAKVIGINPSYLVYHREFSKENELPYQLLADTGNRVQRLFGVPSLFLSSNPKRYTFVIDKEGIVRNIFYSKKDIYSHILEARKTLEKL